MKPGDYVTIYKDPVTRLKPEGKAYLVEPYQQMQDWWVRFPGEDTQVVRAINIRPLQATGIPSVEKGKKRWVVYPSKVKVHNLTRSDILSWHHTEARALQAVSDHKLFKGVDCTVVDLDSRFPLYKSIFG